MARDEAAAAVCPYSEHAAHVQHLERHDDDIERLWTEVTRIRDRLPNWAVLVISVMSAMLGSALTVIGVLVKG